MLQKQLTARKISPDDAVYFNKSETSSHLSFSTILLWGLVYGYNCTVINDALFIYYRYGGRYYAFPPFGPFTDEDIHLFRSHIGEDLTFSPITEEFALSSLAPYCEEPSQERDMFDYVYKTSDLINLSGSKYHAKRNHIAKFLSLYKPEYIGITDQNLDILQEASDHIFSLDSALTHEKGAIDNAIKYFDLLSLRAAVIKVNGRFAGYTIGEKNGDYALIQFEKCDRSFDGIYPYICREFLKTEFSDTLYVNREEDMGIEGLRKSKLSYHPDHFIKMYSAKMK